MSDADYTCPLGHPMPDAVQVPCEACDGNIAVVYQPAARALDLHRRVVVSEAALEQARLYAEALKRSGERETRMIGADLAQILTTDSP